MTENSVGGSAKRSSFTSMGCGGENTVSDCPYSMALHSASSLDRISFGLGYAADTYMTLADTRFETPGIASSFSPNATPNIVHASRMGHAKPCCDAQPPRRMPFGLAMIAEKSMNMPREVNEARAALRRCDSHRLSSGCSHAPRDATRSTSHATAGSQGTNSRARVPPSPGQSISMRPPCSCATSRTKLRPRPVDLRPLLGRGSE